MAAVNLSIKNNFDFLRLIFAAFVIVTHSFPLTGMNEWQDDWLGKITSSQITFSYLGVRGFFIISGYLIFQSLTRSKSVVDYYWKRILRIYPALIVVLLLTVMLAVFPYPYNLTHYLHDPSVLSYFFNNLSLYRLQYSINGVFQDIPAKGIINGSLWTIPYEVSFYILLSSFFLLKKGLEKYVLLFLFILAINLFYYRNIQSHPFLDLTSNYFIEFGSFFIAGSLLASFEIEKMQHKKIVLFWTLALFLISLRFLNFYIFQYFTLPVIVILFGLSSTKYINDIGAKVGDMSYGIYIYGYPVMQTLVHYFKLNYWQLMLCTLPVTFVLAYFSWHLIEKRALQLKKMNPQSILRQLLKRRKTETQVIQNK
jgi:peptidoglycan/LPS O-acetylase OafA/YrhL